MKKFCTIVVILFALVNYMELYATIYTVNSSADDMSGSGTSGTLRYCISTLNGDAAIPHTVNFNISGTAPFIITLTSDLPAITKSGTIIDGTTQSGYASVPVVYLNASGRTNGLYVNNVSGVKIYGLYIYGASKGINITGDAADNFEIGASGKGNHFTRCTHLLYIENADYGKIYYNYFGIHTDKNTTYVPPLTNNYFWGIYFEAATGQDVNNNEIKNNFFGGIQYDAINMQPSGWADFNVIQKNYFGTDATLTKDWVVGYCAIRMENARNNVFGADIGGVLADGNIVGNTNKYSGGDPTAVGLWFVSSRLNRLRMNTYICGMFTSPNGKAIQLMGLGNDNVQTGSCSFAGTILTGINAPPNAIVDIYKSKPSCSYCQGSQFVGTVTANASGGWSYDMAGSGLSVGDGITFQVTATNGNSSEFFDNNDNCNVIVPIPLTMNDDDFENDFSVYPNPAGNKIMIKFKQPLSIYSFSIADITGHIVMKGVLQKQSHHIDISLLNPGFYFITTGNNEKSIVKLLKL